MEVATVLVARAVKPFIGWGGSRGYEPGSGAERSAMTEHFVFNLHLTLAADAVGARTRISPRDVKRCASRGSQLYPSSIYQLSGWCRVYLNILSGVL